MLEKEKTVFVLVDVQGKLARIVYESEFLLNQLGKLIQGLQCLGIPIIWLEQYPEGLGPTVEEISQHLSEVEPISKSTFSACKNESFMQEFKVTGRQQVLIAGIETHICVYQTSVELKEAGYEVQVVEDAVSSRTLENKKLGLDKMKAHGIQGTSVEMAIYELLSSAEAAEFKQILKIIK